MPLLSQREPPQGCPQSVPVNWSFSFLLFVIFSIRGTLEQASGLDLLELGPLAGIGKADRRCIILVSGEIRHDMVDLCI
jgi:hypothetical protein